MWEMAVLTVTLGLGIVVVGIVLYALCRED